jgi:hypothetical protein
MYNCDFWVGAMIKLAKGCLETMLESVRVCQGLSQKLYVKYMQIRMVLSVEDPGSQEPLRISGKLTKANLLHAA